MTEPEELDEDLFADLYDGDDASTQPNQSTKVEASQAVTLLLTEQKNEAIHDGPTLDVKEEPPSTSLFIEQHDVDHGVNDTNSSDWQNGQGGGDNEGHDYGHATTDQVSHGTGIKEDGKMFIGGLNWETTDQSLKDYFSTFGEVQECTVMRDGATGRSRGFGFLTFKDAKTVNSVMVKEHYLDGKIIDPKRAIPRDEQERTSKIFVGGVSQEASETDFKEYFMQYGRVVDATLMMDKDTGRPRGFGFVTFDSEAAVDATLLGDLMILGKPIEVKKAQPRGNMRDEEDRDRRGGGGRRGTRDNDRFRDDRTFNNENNQNQGHQGNQGMYGSGMTPQMMAQYFQKIQMYFANMQQQAAMGNVAGQMGMGGMGSINPTMMQQMQAMRQMQAMQMVQQQMQNRQQDSHSPSPQSPGTQNMQGMTPAVIQQMQQLQQMQMQMQAQQSQGGGFNGQVPGAPSGPSAANASANGGVNGGGASGSSGGRRGTPGYNAQDQLMFEQQKYEHQQRRAVQEQYQQNGITSWEGMYDDVPQPVVGGVGRGGSFNNRGNIIRGATNRTSQGPQSAPPANAPTGPKNAGVPGANYRGGGRGGGHRGGFHPYARK